MNNGRRLLGVAVLGLIQGLTEFLPVSSSGHLVVGQQVLGLAPGSLTLDVVLHLGTLLPVLWLYRADLAAMLSGLPRLASSPSAWSEEPPLRLLVGLLVGSIPTAVIGLLGHDLFASLFSNPLAVSVAFLLTGAILLTAHLLTRSRTSQEGPVTLWRALVVGTAQGLAITPGISRSGTTIAIGLLCGLERELAARFSFVMSIPAILGATLLELRKAGFGSQDPVVLLVGAVVAAISGYLALRWVVRAVKRGELHWFAGYLWPLGLLLLAYELRGG